MVGQGLIQEHKLAIGMCSNEVFDSMRPDTLLEKVERERMLKLSQEIVIQLIALRVGTSNDTPTPKEIDWERVLKLVLEQGVCGVCLDGIEKLPSGTVPQEVLLQWIGQTEQQGWKYRHAWEVACKLDQLWAAEGIHATVLKGRSVA